MENIFWQYFTVYSSSIVKFIFGPLAGIGFGLPIWVTALLTVAGMMTAVLVFTYAGIPLRNWFLHRFFPNRQLFTKRNRRIVRIWRKYGIFGVALLTPLTFTPIGGTLIAVSFGEHKSKILIFMLVSAFFWAFFFSFAISFLGTEVFKF